MRMTILGLGTATPAGTIPQDAAAALATARCCDTPRQARVLEQIYRQTTVRQRGSVLAGNGAGEDGAAAFYVVPDGHGGEGAAGFRGRGRGPGVGERMAAYAERAPLLAIAAAERALAAAQVEGEAISQLVLVSCTGFAAPGLDAELIERLRLPATVERTNIGFMGCHGAINGLRVAQALATQRPGAKVLLVAVELCSLHFQYGWEPQQVVANALFADGAAAMVLEAGDGPPEAASAIGSLPATGTGSCLFRGSRGDMTWTIDDHGFRMTLSARVPGLIEANLEPWLAGWLKGHGLSVAEIAAWAVHPGGPRILTAVERALELPGDALATSRAVLAEHGNMSSPTVLFILDRLRRAGARGPCVLLAFGPGLVAEAALIMIDGSEQPSGISRR